MEDQILVRQVLEGHVNAFRFLVLRYQKPIFKYLRSFGLPDPQVEEVAQDVFVKAYKSLSSYNPEKSQFNTWLFVIAKNSALNVVLKHSYTSEVLVEEQLEVAQDETPLTALEAATIKNNLSHSMNQLPVQFKNVITLFHINEMSLEEISEIEQCNLGTVKSRLHRAKSMLKKIILKNYGTESL